MGFFSRLLRRVKPQLRPIVQLERGAAKIEGVASAITPILHPLDDSPVLAMSYRATASGSVGGITGTSIDQLLEARQATDFLVTDDTGTALIQVERGQDVAQFHAQALTRHGLSMRVEVQALRDGMRVCVLGNVVDLPTGSPHRLQYRAVVRATSFEVIESDDP